MIIYFLSMQFKVLCTSNIDVKEDERILLIVSGVSCQDCTVLFPELIIGQGGAEDEDEAGIPCLGEGKIHCWLGQLWRGLVCPRGRRHLQFYFISFGTLQNLTGVNGTCIAPTPSKFDKTLLNTGF